MRFVDLLFDGARFTNFVSARSSAHTHGTGCTFAAAITAHLALGPSLDEAVRAASEYVAGAIRMPCQSATATAGGSLWRRG